MIGKQRNFGLDVVRAVSILLVVAAHRFNYDIETGVVGVQIFFVLSGFLIGQILINDFKNGGSVSTMLKFWKRRWYRTLPMYYLVLILKILFFGNPYGWKMIVYFFFLQANFVGIDFFPVSWSLIVEEWFYIFLPIVTFFVFKNGISPKRLLYFLGAFILFFLASRFIWNYLHKGIILYQFDCLLLGVVLATIKIYFNKFYLKLNSYWLFLAGLGGTFLFTVQLGSMRNVPLYSVYHRVLWYFLISVCITFVIPYAELSAAINNRLRKVKVLYYFCTWTSILTYSIYLLHASVFQIEFNFNQYATVIFHFILLYLVAFVFYTFYEHPMMSLRDRFSLKQYVESAQESISSLAPKKLKSET